MNCNTAFDLYYYTRQYIKEINKLILLIMSQLQITAIISSQIVK